MTQLKGIGHVLLGVLDLERSKQFYSELPGSDVVAENPEPGGWPDARRRARAVSGTSPSRSTARRRSRRPNFTLKEHGVDIDQPNVAGIFRRGRNDRDVPITFER